MSTKYTSGPWKVSKEKTGTYVTNEQDLYLACVGVLEPSPEENEANAKLIAAAPELLEACKLIQNSNSWDEVCKAHNLLEKAISKAEGE